MASVSFSRDEAILALDTLFFSDEKRLTSETDAIVNLCDLLKSLPIHVKPNENAKFRTRQGVCNQIQGFKRSMNRGEKDPNIGNIFFLVFFDFEDHLNDLHRAAEAIRRNVPYFYSPYGAIGEDNNFQEGVLLGHLHRTIEIQTGVKYPHNDRCVVCQIKPHDIYKMNQDILVNHLIVDPLEMNGKVKYRANDFITVCPNCHAVLHRIRPWITKSKIEEILL